MFSGHLVESVDNQLTSSFLKLAADKPEQAMRKHPDVGLTTARQQLCGRHVATCAFLAVYGGVFSQKHDVLYAWEF